MDASNYNEGKRSGKIRVRAAIEEVDKKTLVIKNIPYGITASTLMDSIVKANDQGKIKIKKVTDAIAKNVEIIIELAPGISPDITIDALYAFTDCELSISPNACVIVDQKPRFLGVQELLKISVDKQKIYLNVNLKLSLPSLKRNGIILHLKKYFLKRRYIRA